MRPVLLNSWEGLGFDINETSVNKLAQEAADLGVKLFVMDDGWFANGVNARINDTAGLGDWDVNTDKFPQGLTPMIENITQLEAAGSDTKLQFGLWFEPEMVNPDSLLYKAHPDWVLHAGSYPRTLTRNQLILNVALPEVQEHIIESLAKYLRSAPITFIKWDNNRGIHETPGPNLDHHYMLGLYRVFQNLTTDFPDVIWNGCASGGGRFDPGILQYFPQVWTSDDTDAVERIAIQFGTSLVYPASAMGAHISHVPNWLTSRETSVRFRAHVAMMGGSFGLELDPSDMDEDEKAEIPDLIKLAEEVQPIVTTGDQYRLGLPGEAKYPAAIYVSEDGEKAVFFAFQTRATINTSWPRFRLQGLDKDAKYKYNGTQVVSGATLMNSGVQLRFRGDQDSKVIILEKQ
jgi:alpha-galactosidase